jgi:uncharacterized protein
MEWYNEPPVWNLEGSRITAISGAKTDFWRHTHYGFVRDNGHFFWQLINGNFTVDVKISGEYRDLYDQAGIMLRLDEGNWLKCGIEFVDNVQQCSAVVTRDYSDWSVVPLAANPASLWLRVTRKNTAIVVEYSEDGQEYTMLRMAYLTAVTPMKVGVMCASPEGNGFSVAFEGFKISNL